MGAKHIVLALLPIFLVLQFSSLIGAVDIVFYESTTTCDGSGYSFNSIGPQVCCEVSAKDGGSVLVTSTSGSEIKSQFYRDGGCTTQVGVGSGDFCLLGGEFSGAYWYSASRRRSLLGDTSSQTCNSQMKPTGVVFTEHGRQGHWILDTSNAAEVYSQMQNVPDAEKASWLQSQGASYKPL